MALLASLAPFGLALLGLGHPAFPTGSATLVVPSSGPGLASIHSQYDRTQSASVGEASQLTISGSASQTLYPGTESTIDLEFTNPTSGAITLPAGALRFTINTPRATCPPSPNFSMVQTLTKAVTIPADVLDDSLANLHIATRYWPVISMVTTHVTQDACEGMTYSLGYAITATATTPVTAGATGAGTGTGNKASSSNPSTVPVHTATASSSGALAFTGLDAALFVGFGGLLLLSGAGILFWLRRSGARR